MFNQQKLSIHIGNIDAEIITGNYIATFKISNVDEKSRKLLYQNQIYLENMLPIYLLSNAKKESSFKKPTDMREHINNEQHTILYVTGLFMQKIAVIMKFIIICR